VRPDDDASPLSIRLFGAFDVRRGGQPLPPLKLRKSRSLLALLVLRRGDEVERDWLAGLLWPEEAQSPALHNLRNCLTDLRHVLGPQAGRLRSPTARTLALDLTGATVDVLAFDAALSRGDPDSLAAAAALYRGPLLEGCAEEWAFQERQSREQAYLAALEQLAGLAGSRGEAAEAERYLRRVVATDPLRESTQRLLMTVLAAGGNYAAVLLVYRELRKRLHRELNAEPDPETSALFQRLREEARKKASASRPARSAGHAPAARIVTGDGSGSNGHAPFTARELALDEETHRGPGGPTAASSPSLSTYGEDGNPVGKERLEVAQKAVAVPHNLPLHLTPFFGREAEVAQLCSALGHQFTASDGARPSESRERIAAGRRLVTLTGPGGSGKTRLALEMVRAPRQGFAGAVCFVSLVDLTDPGLLPERIRDALGLARPSEGDPLEQVVAFLCSRTAETQPFLLLLDNFEQLLTAPPEPGKPGTSDGGAVVWRLLERVDHLQVLVTSRQRLGLPGEREFPVAPLPVPGVQAGSTRSAGTRSGVQENRPEHLNTLSACASVQLFVDRAQAVRPEFQLTIGNATAVAKLCQRLEGLPLAIELAAARAAVLTPEQMLKHLEQREGARWAMLVGRQRAADPRHHSLRAALDWSYQLLTPELQRFFARLSVFRGGWTAEAAEAVCEEPRALEYLEQVRGCSLVQATETAGGIRSFGEHPGCGEVVMRFHLLETLREYGADQLAVDERAAAAQRHARFFLALAETAEREMAQGDQRLWLDRLEREHDNLRAALAGAVESGEIELGLRLGSALEEFWSRRGYLKEGRDQLLRLLAHPAGAAPTAARARALSVTGLLMGLQTYPCDLQPPRRWHAESLAIWRALGDRAGISRALLHMALEEWDPATARPLAEESLAIRRELGDPRVIAEALSCLAEIHRQEHDLPAACVLIEEGLTLWRALDDRAQIHSALGDLGYLTFRQGDMDRARCLIEESLAVAQELDDRVGIAWAITRLGYVAHMQEDYPAARTFFEQSLPLWRELEVNNGLVETLFHLAHLRQQEGDYTGAYAMIEEMGAVMREGNSDATGSFGLLGLAAAELGRWEEAATHCGKRLRLFHSREDRHPHILAWTLTGMARVALARGRAARAARLVGAAAALWQVSHLPGWPTDRAALERAVSAVRAQLEESEFAAAWAEGQAMPVEQVIAEALEEAPAG
jgi:predicted ATPase/DNA-binding SARP family transcriptional activator